MSKIFAVICEFNPIHLGHKYVIERARRDSGDNGVVICVMSGNLTQRCTPAIFDKYTRAEAALSCGADIVAELPFPWACAGAESFARGAVAVAGGMGADTLIFGSESGDLDLILKAAEIKSSAEYRERIIRAEKSRRETGSAVLFDSVMNEMGLDVPLGANDKLGCEYVRFGKMNGINKYTILKRISDCKSASELREVIFSHGLSAAREDIPDEAYDVFAAHEDEICREERFFGILFDYCRLYVPSESENAVIRYAKKTARECKNFTEFMKALSTKKYTAARMRREILFSILGTAPGDVKRNPLHTVLLGASESGRRYLSDKKGNFKVSIITKPADYSMLCDIGKREYRTLNSADEMYCLCSERCGGYYMKQHPAFR